MKKLITLTMVLCGFAFSYAQVTEQERSMTQGMNNALVINIPNADDKAVEKLWKKHMKSKGSKAKKIKRSEEWFSDNAKIPGVGGSNSVDVYATFEQSSDDVLMTVWFDMDGSYLNSNDHQERFSAGETFLSNFEYEVYKDRIRSEIKSEENNLKKLESNMKKLKKNNDRYHKEIEDAKKKIAKAEANIEDNIQEQEETDALIEAQKEVVELTKKKLDIREDN